MTDDWKWTLGIAGTFGVVHAGGTLLTRIMIGDVYFSTTSRGVQILISTLLGLFVIGAFAGGLYAAYSLLTPTTTVVSLFSLALAGSIAEYPNVGLVTPFGQYIRYWYAILAVTILSAAIETVVKSSRAR